ncbi:MAG TPA: uroporphyrinogen-III synthase [Chitinophagaceae bacterium]
MQQPIQILSTRPLSDEVLQEAAERNVSVDVIPFIDTVTRTTDPGDEITQLLNESIVAIFTSANAVEALAGLKGDHKPRWKIFCIGEATAILVQKYFGENAIAGKAGNAQSLANVILQQPVITEAVYFCGDKRRAELPKKLADHGIGLREVIVYDTHLTPHAVEKKYDAILFFSPSAVESFFSINEIDSDVILFAIGNTTGDAIKRISGNRTITASITDKDELARQAVAHFTSTRAAG